MAAGSLPQVRSVFMSLDRISRKAKLRQWAEGNRPLSLVPYNPDHVNSERESKRLGIPGQSISSHLLPPADGFCLYSIGRD